MTSDLGASDFRHGETASDLSLMVCTNLIFQSEIMPGSRTPHFLFSFYNGRLVLKVSIFNVLWSFGEILYFLAENNFISSLLS
jgi:hypothetical protein